MTRPRKRDWSLTTEQAMRGLYIDFEGFKGKPPALIGILVDGALEQVVLDERLRLAADAKGLRVATLAEVGLELLGRCVKEQRVIIAFSQHEQTMFSAHAQLDIEEYYRNARTIGQRYLRDSGLAGRGDPRSLKEMLECIGYTRDHRLGEQKSTKRLREVLTMLDKWGSYERLTATAKGKWTKLLCHNEHDCRGMSRLVEKAIAFRDRRAAGPHI